MEQEGLSRKAYPSDLTDEQWALVEPMIPPTKRSPRGGRPREVDMREVLNTIFGTFHETAKVVNSLFGET
jgi:transposase